MTSESCMLLFFIDEVTPEPPSGDGFIISESGSFISDNNNNPILYKS